MTAKPLALILAAALSASVLLAADAPAPKIEIPKSPAAAPAEAGVPAATTPAAPATGAGEVPAKPALPAKSAKASGEPKQSGGETEGIVQVANLIYAGTKSSKCFSDHFLIEAEKASSISTSRRFHAVKMAGEELFEFPMVIMTGEGAFELLDSERQNLRKYIERGGFLIASAGCSSPDWDRSFRSEMVKIFAEIPLAAIPMEHAVFHTVHDITELKAKHGSIRPLEGISMGGRLGVLYSQDGLNDTAHSQGCCCCGGNEITNCVQINVNILAYALTH